MELYNRVTGSTVPGAGNHTQLKGSWSRKTEPIELELSMGLTEAIGLMKGLEWM